SVPACAGSRRYLRVAAQLAREIAQRNDVARLGAAAPVLQASEQLLARVGRALPQRSQLLPHDVDRLQCLAAGESRGEARTIRFRKLLRVGVEPSAKASQARNIDRNFPASHALAQRCDLAGVRPLQ